jgi:cytochrome c5
MRRILVVALAGVVLGCGTPPPAPSTPVVLSERQALVFQRICSECHARGDIGSPMLGDEDAWKPRRAKGLDVLLANTVNGYGQMPPLGTCGFCTEEDFRHLVVYVSGMSADVLTKVSQPQ